MGEAVPGAAGLAAGLGGGRPGPGLFVSNATGTYELYAWDRATGDAAPGHRPAERHDGRRAVARTARGSGGSTTPTATSSASGGASPSAGGEDVAGRARAWPPPTRPGWRSGADGRRRRRPVRRTTRARPSTSSRAGEPSPSRSTGTASRRASATSREDGTLVVDRAHRARRRDARALRVVRVADGTTVAELDDTEGGTRELGLDVPGLRARRRRHPAAGRPPAARPLAAADLGRRRPARRPSWRIDLPGDVHAEWYPGRPARCWSCTTTTPAASCSATTWRRRALTRARRPRRASVARRRPPGRTARWSTCGRRPREPPAVRSTTGARRARRRPGRARPASVPVEDVWVDGPGGRIHALVQRPAGRDAARCPTVFEVHGGPTWHDADAFAAAPGRLGRPRLRGRPGQLPRLDRLRRGLARRARSTGSGLIELEDIAAVRDGPVATGPRRPRAGGAHRRLLGRLPDPARPRRPAGARGRWASPPCRWRTTSRRTRTRWRR